MKKILIIAAFALLLGCSKQPGEKFVGRLEYTPNSKAIAILHTRVDSIPIHPKVFDKPYDVYRYNRELVEVEGFLEYMSSDMAGPLSGYWLTKVTSIKPLE
jgi:hypothetical protein